MNSKTAPPDSRPLSIAYGNSCYARFWSNKTATWQELCERLQTTIRTTETVEEYRKMNKNDRDKAKDRGGFVGGLLSGNRRLINAVKSRSMLTLDVDHAEVGFIERFVSTCPYAACVYSTHSHTPEQPRCRIIMPLKRDITPDEHTAVARYVAAEYGVDQFDECSFKANQMMYWPTTPANGEYICEIIDREWLDPDAYLTAHPDWRDISTLPTSERESHIRERCSKPQEDPLTKNGIVGAFCRTYDIPDAIATFLPEVYEESAVSGRYDYIKGEGKAGVVIYDDKFAYSHHATDPASGKLLNAFDLVRIHRFGDENEKQSFKAMAEFAAADENVNRELLLEKQEQAKMDFGENWTKVLQRDRNGILVNSLHNLRLIFENDENLKNIRFNQLADSLEITGEVPWNHPGKYWRDADDAQLTCYVDAHYGTFSLRNFEVVVTKVADDRSYHPIKEYFASLPKWDGIPRVDTLFSDYLGAEDTPYTHAVTRKTLCAAHERVYHPGVKFDYTPVLNGSQGIGKSTIIARLGMEWFSDSLSLSDMNDKTAAEKLQGYWLMEIGELAGMKKADIDKVKAFVSRQDDKYRASFGRRVTPHPRQCIFIGTTNAENGYLRDVTGNRRYWNIRVNGKGKYKPWDMTQETVDQIWAEVVVLCEQGETLFLPPELEQYAAKEQRMAMEQDDREGLVAEYLDTLLPEGWETMDIYSRRSYLRETDAPTRPRGVIRRTEVSNIEIWCECFGKPAEDMKNAESRTVSAIMLRLTDWEKTDTRKRRSPYGQQRIYTRKP